VAIDVESHGRDSPPGAPDVSRTAGWFTSLYPVTLEISRTPDPGGAVHDIAAVKDALAKVPMRGVGYGLLRYIARDPVLSSLPAPQLSFNYLGQFSLASDGVFRMAEESSGSAIGERNPRFHAIDVTAVVHDGRLHLTLTYSRNRFEDESMQSLARAIQRHLASMSGEDSGAQDSSLSPSDFDLVTLSQEEIDNIFA
jgi:non-ribosomal peptide synthase protein (TIGR01720 family)